MSTVSAVPLLGPPLQGLASDLGQEAEQANIQASCDSAP